MARLAIGPAHSGFLAAAQQPFTSIPKKGESGDEPEEGTMSSV